MEKKVKLFSDYFSSKVNIEEDKQIPAAEEIGAPAETDEVPLTEEEFKKIVIGLLKHEIKEIEKQIENEEEVEKGVDLEELKKAQEWIKDNEWTPKKPKKEKEEPEEKDETPAE